ncbi:hypothetical protein Salat_0770900 [Sesamum alatum]|uniref:Uncharacterized protein n=1 Tax=Sesamum alatum TaxID=300844 RepID=A0AAE1YU16_9LAMI|nr:hypothetical protein Salat_0770900 [Sesamum alatum]
MEQGLAENSSATSSEQNVQSNFAEPRLSCELSQVVHPSPQGCPNDNVGFSYQNDRHIPKFQPPTLELPGSSLNKQADDAGPSLSIVPFSAGPSLSSIPFSGEHLAPSEPGSEDLFAVYLKGISQSHDHHSFQQENQVANCSYVVAPINNQIVLHASNDQVMDSPYLDRMSNLPNEYPMSLTLSKPGGQWSGSSQISAPFGNLVGDSTIINTLHSQWATQAHPTPRKLPWQEDIAPVQKRWNSFVRGDHGESSRASISFVERFTLYDKRYEEIGLPLDPHLRIFTASKENSGNVRLEGRHSKSTYFLARASELCSSGGLWIIFVY